MKRELYNKYGDLVSRFRGEDDGSYGYEGLHYRRHMVVGYAWAIPALGILNKALKLSPLIEIGAGRGYWARCLRDLGADILAFDPRIKDGQYEGRRCWTDVANGDHRVVANHPHRTLLLVWPCYAEDWAAQALELYRGKHLIYVGEYRACCANDRFFDLLECHWTEKDDVPIPRWRGLYDHAWIYERQEAGT